VLGPLVGGFITDKLSWRWIFYLNLPVGIAAAAIIGIALVEPQREERPVIDYAGAAILTGAVTTLLLVLGSSRLFTGRNAALTVLVIVLFAIFAAVERRAKDPIVPFSLFRNRVVAVSIGIGFLAGISMFAAITFVPLLAQGVFGATATEAGTFLTPLMLSWVIASIIGGRLLIHVGSRVLVLSGLTMMSAGFVALATFSRHTPRGVMMAELVLIGCGLGLTMLTLLIAAQHSVPRELLGITTSLNQFSRSIGGALGVGILGALLATGLGRYSDNPNALINREARASVSPSELAALQGELESTLRQIFTVSAAVAGLALLMGFALPPGRVGEAHGERMVMAEMATLEPESEPEG
jgi:MFS family permease